MVARYVGVVEAVGSSPVTPTSKMTSQMALICHWRGYFYIKLWTLAKSFLTAIFFVDVKHIDYLVRCPCFDFVECVNIYS